MNPHHLARARLGGRVRWGWLEDGCFRPLTARGNWPATMVADGPAVDIKALELLPPVSPTKVVCAGRTYAGHALELGNALPEEPLIFLKPPSALLAHGGKVVKPGCCQRLDFEGEVAVVVQHRLHRATPDEAQEAIAGVLPLLDMTARCIQKREGLFTRAKGFDTFAPAGPSVLLGGWTEDVSFQTWVDGVVRQEGSTQQMTRTVPELLAYVSRVMTLEPGDVLATGTPAGAGPVELGQTIDLELRGIGMLSVTVVAEEDESNE